LSFLQRLGRGSIFIPKSGASHTRLVPLT